MRVPVVPTSHQLSVVCQIVLGSLKLVHGKARMIPTLNTKRATRDMAEKRRVMDSKPTKGMVPES